MPFPPILMLTILAHSNGYIYNNPIHPKSHIRTIKKGADSLPVPLPGYLQAPILKHKARSRAPLSERVPHSVASGYKKVAGFWESRLLRLTQYNVCNYLKIRLIEMNLLGWRIRQAFTKLCQFITLAGDIQANNHMKTGVFRPIPVYSDCHWYLPAFPLVLPG